MKRNEDSLRDFWDSTKHGMHIIGVPEEEKTEKAPEEIFDEIIGENFLTWEKK